MVLLVPVWNEGCRHGLALHLAGAMLRRDPAPDEERVVEMVGLLARVVGDGEVEDRVRSVRTPDHAACAGSPVTGRPRVARRW